MPITSDNEFLTKLNSITLSDNWIDLFYEEFYVKTFNVLQNKEKSIEIVYQTFLFGAKNTHSYDYTINDRTWLLNILNKKIKESLTITPLVENIKLSIEKVLNKIPKVQKDVFVHKTYQGYSTEEVCSKFEISEKQFWNYIHNTRIELTEVI